MGIETSVLPGGWHVFLLQGKQGRGPLTLPISTDSTSRVCYPNATPYMVLLLSEHSAHVGIGWISAASVVVLSVAVGRLKELVPQLFGQFTHTSLQGCGDESAQRKRWLTEVLEGCAGLASAWGRALSSQCLIF